MKFQLFIFQTLVASSKNTFLVKIIEKKERKESLEAQINLGKNILNNHYFISNENKDCHFINHLKSYYYFMNKEETKTHMTYETL